LEAQRKPLASYCIKMRGKIGGETRGNIQKEALKKLKRRGSK